MLFVPCAGPVLTAISVVSAHHRVGLGAVVLTVDFALGASVPLLVFALAGQRVAERVAAFRSRAVVARQIGGVVLLTMTLLIAFNVTDGLQRVVPGYTTPCRTTSRVVPMPSDNWPPSTGAKKSGELGSCAPGTVDTRGVAAPLPTSPASRPGSTPRAIGPCRWRR